MSVSIRRLQEDHFLDSFDCGDEPLNTYLKKYAWINQQKISIGVTYVATDQAAPKKVIGYFTLAMAAAPRDSFPKQYVRGLPAYDLPAILLGRLAVDLRFRSRGLGKALLVEAIKISSAAAGQIGCRYVIVDAYGDAVQWYQHFGFVPMETRKTISTRMCLDIRKLREAINAAVQ